MAILLHCPKCGKKFSVADESKATGRQCRYCKAELVVSRQGGEAAEPASPNQFRSDQTSTSQESGELPAQIGRYQIRAQLGAGAFGRVYRAFDPNLKREVALKVLHPERVGNPKTAERFLREAAAGARLRHSYIVPVFDSSRHGEQCFIVTAYIKGHTLKEALEIGAWDFRQSAEAVRKLAMALHHAHNEGIVHRDVKPANILIDEKGDPQLTDFGLASLQDASFTLTQDGAALGTPAYMAPEQYLGAKDKSVDQFSLGVLFFEMLCGELPFTGHPAARGRVDPPSLRACNPKIPPKLEAICLKALAKKPEDRYTHCQALANDLQSWLEPTAEQCRPLAPSQELPKIDSRDVARREQGRWAAELKCDPTWVNTLGMRFRLIPAGRFLLGAPEDDPSAQSNERPRREVTMAQPFWAAVFPVTNAVIRAFLEGPFEPADTASTSLVRDRSFASRCRRGDREEDGPVVEVSAVDAELLCAWLRRHDGKHYRLPTEGEWEYLARAGSTASYWWESHVSPTDAAVFARPAPQALDPRRANAWGLVDVLGNVSEWTASAYSSIDSSSVLHAAGVIDGSTRTVRGGSFKDRLQDIRLSRRLSMSQGTRRADLGFRVVFDAI